MKLLITAALSILATHTADAQTAAMRDGAARSAFVARGQASYPSLSGPPRATASDGEPRECLRERKTKRIVCHTRMEWQSIAGRLGAEPSPND